MINHNLSPLFQHLLNTSGAQTEEHPAAYDIERLDENHYRITMSVPGFSEDDLTLTLHNDRLSVKGHRSPVQDEAKPRIFLHRGLSAHGFENTFYLDKHMRTSEVQLHNGMLTIQLERIVPEEEQPQTLAITKPKA